ncbi:hypothetical protein H0H87_001433 [Tephrocybe sp. NHM501043]|nr:hypothetical protein H0H87_001433 [Tephrocybe sp. NHM501043]
MTLLNNDVLSEVIAFLRLDDWPPSVRPFSIGSLVTDVDPQWHDIVLREAGLWTDVFITPDSPAAVTRIALHNSQGRELSVTFWAPANFRGDFNESSRLVVEQINRWHKISITSTHPPLLHLTNQFMHRPMPRLTSMELFRSDTGAVVKCGPFGLYTSAFKHLVLNGVVMRVRLPAHLSSVRSLTIASTDLRMLNQLYVNLATDTGNETPAFAALEHLTISGPILGEHRLEYWSVNPSTIRSLTLRGPFTTLRSSNSDTVPHEVANLMKYLVTARLQYLEVSNLGRTETAALFNSLFSPIQDVSSRVSGLHALTLTSLDLRGSGFSRALIPSLFPRAISLTLTDVIG